MKESLISVIIPVYNVKGYLSECIESVINQTYKNLEIILIDDGSNDGSEKICDEYSQKDNRIKVIHQENNGISKVRNVGLQNATGAYIQFIDSDDYIEKDLIEKLYKNVSENEADIGIVNHYILKNGTLKEDATNQIYIFSKEEALQEILLDGKIRSYLWGKLFKAEVFDGIVFPETKAFEDLLVMTKIFRNANRTIFYDYPMYYYRQREGSILHVQTSELRLNYIRAVNENINFVKENIPGLGYYCAYSFVNMVLNTYDNIGFFKMNDLLDNTIIDDIYYKAQEIMENVEYEKFIVEKTTTIKKLHLYFLMLDRYKYIESNRNIPALYPENE